MLKHNKEWGSYSQRTTYLEKKCQQDAKLSVLGFNEQWKYMLLNKHLFYGLRIFPEAVEVYCMALLMKETIKNLGAIVSVLNLSTNGDENLTVF